MAKRTGRRIAAKKAAATRKRRAAGKKAAATRKHREAGQKAAAKRKQREAGRKAATTKKASIAAKKRSEAAKKANETRKRNVATKESPATKALRTDERVFAIGEVVSIENDDPGWQDETVIGIVVKTDGKRMKVVWVDEPSETRISWLTLHNERIPNRWIDDTYRAIVRVEEASCRSGIPASRNALSRYAE